MEPHGQEDGAALRQRRYCTTSPLPARACTPYAALANGVFSTFEQEAVREPGVGTHAGATLILRCSQSARKTASMAKPSSRIIAGVE